RQLLPRRWLELHSIFTGRNRIEGDRKFHGIGWLNFELTSTLYGTAQKPSPESVSTSILINSELSICGRYHLPLCVQRQSHPHLMELSERQGATPRMSIFGVVKPSWPKGWLQSTKIWTDYDSTVQTYKLFCCQPPR